MIRIENYKAGIFIKDPSGYSYFLPTKIFDNWEYSNSHINKLLEEASHRIGELNTFAEIVPDVSLFIQMMVTKEAVVSSKIEGTQTNIDEALMPEIYIDEERKNDWREVNNYIISLTKSIEELNNIPLSTRLIKTAHYYLLQGVRGEEKLPGEFRRSQNWIGGSTLSNAVFIPPHHSYVNELMGDLENFMQQPNVGLPYLIRTAIAHYQFETIHPFLDGNGRVGRLIIPLYFIEKKLLSKPIIYISKYFESNRNLYYDMLMRVRTKNDLLSWVDYFLTGIIETAEDSLRVLKSILEMKKRLENILINRRKRGINFVRFLNFIFSNPIFTIHDAMSNLNLTFKSVSNLVKNFRELNIIKEITGRARGRLFVFEQYLKLFE